MPRARHALCVLVSIALGVSGCSLGGLVGLGGERKPNVQAEGACVTRDQANWAKMAAYLEANKTKDGVQVTPSGLQYRVVKAAEAGAKQPVLTSLVQVHYRGALIDGTVFDESIPPGPPAEFEAGQVIKGWQEALTRMREGEVWEVVIPSELAYGCRGTGPIPPDQVLVFEIALLRVN